MKTAKQLKISNGVYEALIKVFGMLDAGEIPEKGFNMALWLETNGRGKTTCGCIGGWAESCGEIIALGDSPFGLINLCFPSREKVRGGGSWNYSTITREQGARALENYLNTGKAKWTSILAPKTWKNDEDC